MSFRLNSFRAANDLVDQRFDDSAKDHNDMLGSFIRHGVTRKECADEIPFQIIAGSDTTATAIRGTILSLSASRTAYNRLQREIDEFVGQGRISDPVQAEEAKNMKYLQVGYSLPCLVVPATETSAGRNL